MHKIMYHMLILNIMQEEHLKSSNIGTKGWQNCVMLKRIPGGTSHNYMCNRTVT